MKWLITINVLLCSIPARAQHAHELGIFTEPIYSPTEVAVGRRLGVHYKYYCDEKTVYRLSASVSGIYISTWDRTHFRSNDTDFALLNSWHIMSKIPVLSAGIQWNKKLSRRVSWYYGTDVNVGYQWGKKDSITFSDYVSAHKYSTGPTDTSFLIYASSQRSKAQANMLYMGLQPFTGISAKWNRINTALEVSGLFAGSVLTTKNAQYTSMRWGGFNARLSVGYSFGKECKQSETKAEYQK